MPMPVLRGSKESLRFISEVDGILQQGFTEKSKKPYGLWFARNWHETLFPGRDFAAYAIFTERSKLSFFRIQPPPPENNSQARHHRNRKINPENACDFASGHHPKNRRQRMQLHALPHDARRRNVI